MLNDITIYRDLPVLAGYVQVPPANRLVLLLDAESTLPDAVDVAIGQSCGETTGRKQGRQHLFRLPGVSPSDWYTIDPVQLLRNLGGT